MVRGFRVIIDHDLAKLYGVLTSRLNEQVKRNIDRFPEDFMFQLTSKEQESLRSQNAISKKGQGGRRYLPYVFTEQGVAMVSSVLNSPEAVQVNIQIMRTFVKIRELMISHKDLAQKIENLEHKFKTHNKNFRIVFEAIKRLIDTPEKDKGRIVFMSKEKLMSEYPIKIRAKFFLWRLLTPFIFSYEPNVTIKNTARLKKFN